MGVFQRVAKIVASNLADHKERSQDPKDQMEVAYQEMIASLSEVKSLIGEVAAAHQRLVADITELERQVEQLEHEAGEAVLKDDDARARELLTRRQKIQEKLAELRVREIVAKQKLDRLHDAAEDLRSEVRDFRDQRDDLQEKLSSASASLAMKKATAAIHDVAHETLNGLDDQVRIAEARAELSESIEEQLERLKQSQ